MWDCRIPLLPPPPPPLPVPLQILITFTLFFWYLQKRKTKAIIIRELKPVKQQRRRQQRERQKSNRFRLAKHQLFCTLLHDHNVKVPNFTFCRGRRHKTTTFFFSFPELWYSPSEFNSKNNLPHMTSRRPYWCPKTMKRRPCWCLKPVLWELNSFLMQTLSFVLINLHRCWPR